MLPRRAVKPRETGLTMVIDGGVPLGQFTDQIELGAEYIDYVKFGWGTSIVTNCLREKIAVLEGSDIGFYFGGTLFEKFVLQARFEDYRERRQGRVRGVEHRRPRLPVAPGEHAKRRAGHLVLLHEDGARAAAEVARSHPRTLRPTHAPEP
jgi:hypothetical protein